VSATQSGEFVESDLKKEKKATVGRVCGKEKRFYACNKRVREWRIMRVVSRWNRSKTCHSQASLRI